MQRLTRALRRVARLAPHAIGLAFVGLLAPLIVTRVFALQSGPRGMPLAGSAFALLATTATLATLVLRRREKPGRWLWLAVPAVLWLD